MKILTKLEALEKSSILWHEIAKKGYCDKRDYFTSNNIPEREIPLFKCYLCQYVKVLVGKINCIFCPVIWGGKGIHFRFCGRKYSPYKKWGKNRTSANALKVAKLIDKYWKMAKRKQTING